MMKSVRESLLDGIDYTTLVLVHHAQNAARARVYAAQGNRHNARWYGQRAREDLASYLRFLRAANQP